MATQFASPNAHDLDGMGASLSAPRFTTGLAADVAQLHAVAVRDRWGRALIRVGWCHLVCFLACQWLYGLGDRAPSHFMPIWGLDLALGVLMIRKSLSVQRPGPIPPLFGVVARIWITFLILAFSVASLNAMIGFQTDWFKAMWAVLSTFGFATMAWIFHLKFLIPAVQMSFTALLIARFPGYAYGIYGLSWCLALNTVGLALERRRPALFGARQGSGSKRSWSVARPVDIA